MMNLQGRAQDTVSVPLDAVLERTKALLADAMRPAKSVRACGERLQRRDGGEGRLGGELARQHVWRVPPATEGARPTAIVIQNHILRPPKQAVVEVQARSASPPATS